jgi:hypothetical protein
MRNNGELIEKLRTYLTGLSSQAREMLVRSIETGRAKGEVSQVHDIIMEALRDIIRKDGEEVDRTPTAERAFFQPLEPFLIEQHLPVKVRGRIQRDSLRPIWVWLTRDVAPDTLDAELAEARAASAEEQTGRLYAISKVLRVGFLAEAHQYIDLLEEKYGGLFRLSAQLGGERKVEDLHDILEIIEIEDELESFRSHLPEKIPANPEGFQIILAALKELPNIPSEKMVFFYASLLPHFNDVSDIVKFAAFAAKSSNAVLVRKSPYESCISLLFSEITKEVEIISQSLTRNRDSVETCKAMQRYYHHVRVLSGALDLEDKDPWMRELVKIRVALSERISPEIEPASTLVRRTLRLVKNKKGEIAPDAHTVSDAIFSVRILMACRSISSALALNTMINESVKVVETSIETLGQRALSDLEEASGDNRMARIKRADAAIALAEVAFGSKMAETLDRKRQHILKNMGLPTEREFKTALAS